MRTLILNKFLHRNGGSETYIFKLGEALEQHGHEVQYFGMEHEGRCVGNRVNAYTSDMDFHGGSKLSKLTYPIKTIYSKEARVQLRKVLDDFKPDVCHLNNFNYQLTPSIILEIVKWRKETGRDCKIIFTAHDYQLVCPKGAWIKIIHTRNCGVSAARNTGIENATSDYIVFIDPDDTVKENYFSTIKAFMTSTSVDVAILGFYQIVEDKDGNVVKEGEVFPQKNYISNSVEETVRTVLPKYLGYSVEDILEWVNSTEAISKRLEWGAVWRNVYRRDFLNKNQIRFNPSIRLNEDSMFNR